VGKQIKVLKEAHWLTAAVKVGGALA
jgi:hypothetical protein